MASYTITVLLSFEHKIRLVRLCLCVRVCVCVCVGGGGGWSSSEDHTITGLYDCLTLAQDRPTNVPLSFFITHLGCCRLKCPFYIEIFTISDRSLGQCFCMFFACAGSTVRVSVWAYTYKVLVCMCVCVCVCECRGGIMLLLLLFFEAILLCFVREK